MPAKAGADEPAPASLRNLMRLLGHEQVVNAEARRELLAEPRANGVEREQRDGGEFVVLRLPSLAPDDHARAPKIAPRRASGFAIA